MQIYKSMILSDIIYRNPTIIPIISRFGIQLGLGDKTILEIAREHDIDADFFVLVLNTYLNEDYFPEVELQSLTAEQVSEYLTKTDDYYLHLQLPNIEKHLNAFIRMSTLPVTAGGQYGEKGKTEETDGTENPLTLLSKLLEDFKEALRVQIEDPSRPGDQAEQILAEMQHIMIRFLSGNYNENLCYATVFAVNSMENDLRRHNRIRRRIFHPVLEAEMTGRKAVSRRQAEYRETKKLTPRELEVLKLIVEGKLNKEIADRLHISFQTVLTHRKNITSKLGIKTVSGLTFYAIMNGLVKAM